MHKQVFLICIWKQLSHAGMPLKDIASSVEELRKIRRDKNDDRKRGSGA